MKQRKFFVYDVEGQRYNFPSNGVFFSSFLLKVGILMEEVFLQ